MYPGAVVVRLVIGRALKLSAKQVALLISADLFCCGLVPLIQPLGFGRYFGIRQPVLMGVTFAALGPMMAMANASASASASASGSGSGSGSVEGDLVGELGGLAVAVAADVEDYWPGPLSGLVVTRQKGRFKADARCRTCRRGTATARHLSGGCSVPPRRRRSHGRLPRIGCG